MYKLSSVMQGVNVHICYIAIASLQDDYVYSGVSTGNRVCQTDYILLRTLSRMYFVMCTEALLHTHAFVTLTPFVRFLSTLKFLVNNNVRFSP